MQKEHTYVILFMLVLSIAAITAYVTAMYQTSGYKSSASETIPPPTGKVCGQECLSAADCGDGLTCGKICTSGDCPPQSKMYCHNPQCPAKTFVVDWQTQYTLWSEKFNPRDDSIVEISERCENETTMSIALNYDVIHEPTYEESLKKCSDWGTTQNHPYCQLLLADREQPNAGYCHCQNKPFGSGKKCSIKISGSNAICRCLGDRPLASMTSCSCTPSLSIPVCRDNEVVLESDYSIEFAGLKPTPSDQSGTGSNCSTGVKKITCDDGREFNDIQAPCKYHGEDSEFCSDSSGNRSSDPSENRWCVQDYDWKLLAKTLCNAPKLQKSQCVGFRSYQVSQSSCDSICGKLYGSTCQKTPGDSTEDIMCCPDNPEVEGVWTWALHEISDVLLQRNKNFMPAECFKPTPVPRGIVIDPINPPINSDDTPQSTPDNQYPSNSETSTGVRNINRLNQE